MSGGPDGPGAGGSGVLQDDWMEILLGFHPRTLTKTPTPGAPAKVGPAAKADTCDTPQASGTTLFFDFDSVELTDSDKMLLDGYAKAYLRLGSTAKIKVVLKSLGRLDGALHRVDASLADTLARAGRATDASTRKIGLDKAKETVARFVQNVKAEPLISHMDRNPFGVVTGLQPLLLEGLTRAAKAIG